ncbi:winged helix-turn-helix transcriptional regulator [Nocardioides zeae]|uniref:Two-component system OmpR family response regulator n=1 Tax=Nocardioides zeae TaxID=1457234 RepID=A0AAJ1TWL8_9ACTN|nr:response regulator transcription factor [Nocardioides zeae]MDQ1103660.1 two-component system OmpR family response regulator [Nocardioides zeae]
MEQPPARRVAVIIEDDPDVADLLDLVLTQSGYVTHVTRNGVDGLAAVREHDPVLTTLDVSMPGMDGFAVARRIRDFSSTYLIMITALSDEIDVVMGLEAGADDYLTKPFRPRELRARAESMLRRPRDRGETGRGDGPENDPQPQHDATPAVPEREATGWAVDTRRQFSEGNRATIGPVPTEPEPQQAPRHVTPPPAEQPEPQLPPIPPLPPVPPTAPTYAEPLPAAYEQPAQQQVTPPVQQPPYQQQVPPPVQQPVAAAPAIGTTPASAMAAGAAQQVVASDGWVRHNNLALNPTSRVVLVDGRGVDLTTVEFDLLASLVSTGRRVRSKADLVLTMRGQDYVTAYFVNEADKRTVEAHLEDLRRKLGDVGAVPRLIEPVRGVGYRMAATI